MAKKKATAATTKARADDGPRQTVLTIKGTPEWKAWLDDLGDHCRMPASTIVDHALVKYAKEMGFQKEAPRR